MFYILTLANHTCLLALSHKHAVELHRESDQSHLPAHSEKFGGGTIGDSKSYNPTSDQWYVDNRLGLRKFMTLP